jgi:hypothetical protein
VASDFLGHALNVKDNYLQELTEWKPLVLVKA